jgi:hypothetical protein
MQCNERQYKRKCAFIFWFVPVRTGDRPHMELVSNLHQKLLSSENWRHQIAMLLQHVVHV